MLAKPKLVMFKPVKPNLLTMRKPQLVKPRQIKHHLAKLNP